MKKRILFVCLGNICRSPSAEAVMNAIVKNNNTQELFHIDSAGILSVHAGAKADARMSKHALKRGYNLTSISRQVIPAIDFDEFDLIIGMDDQNIRDLMYLARTESHQKKVAKMTDFATDKTWSEVPDPYYGGDAGFELVLDILEDACKGLYKHVISNNS
jgi:protein-tyrosine phosphatase